MIDMTNQKFNKLTVIKFDHYDKKGNSYWLCRCECGNYKVWLIAQEENNPHIIELTDCKKSLLSIEIY